MDRGVRVGVKFMRMGGTNEGTRHSVDGVGGVDNEWMVGIYCECLPGDESGRKALRHICKAHNESLVDA